MELDNVPRFLEAAISIKENSERREIASNVFLMSICDDEQHHLEDVIAIEIEVATRLLSSDAVKAGFEHGGCLYYTSPYRYLIPLYELLKAQLVIDYDIIREFSDLDELYSEGQYFCSDYFGELEKASRRTDIHMTGCERVSNGIDAFQYENGDAELVIHKVAANYELSGAAQAYALPHGCHLHYRNENRSIPLYELSDSHPSLNRLISDRQQLIGLLLTHFSPYLTARGIKLDEQG